MDDCATQTMRFETEGSLALEAAFDGGRLTSDGGLLWLARVDSEMGLCEAISECVPQWRRRKARHSLASLVRQRVFQIACGYDDQNDSDTLREDPLLKLCCGSLPKSGLDLASQPTISRMENAATMRSCHRIAEVLFEIYLRERERDGAPKKVLLWTSTRPQIQPTESRKAPSTMATTNSTSTIRSSSSTARADISSRRF
jgi:hypothetical protein